MIEERLEQTFMKLGFRRINSNTAGIYLFYYITEEEINIVSVIHTMTGSEPSKEQYLHILEQIINNFRRDPYPNRIRLLSLILTTEVNRVKHLCIDNVEGQHWVIDLFANRLIIYETGSGDFKNIRDQLEDLLAEEELQRNSNEEMRYNHPASGTYRREPNVNIKERLRAGYRLFTLINTIIIIVNILVFLIQRYTPFFGGEDRILGTGALSWYYVIREKEYYRVITSMFLHADFGHIFNNMLVLFFVGDNLERAVGKLKYLFIYFGAGILAGITSISYNMWKESGQYLIENYIFSIGASGAIFGVVGAMLYIVIVNRGKSEDISTRQMVLFVVFSLYGGIMNTRIDQAAHVGGFLAGIVLAAILYRRTKRGAVAESL